MHSRSLRLLFLAASCAAIASLNLPASETATAADPGAALARLAAGNRRFVEGTAQHGDQSAERRRRIATAQHPFAIILTCADSRLSPELIFDEGLGDLFVIRNAGNVLDDHVLASMEYAAEHLGAPLVVVLGHTQCGAIKAAVAGGELPGHLPALVGTLRPAVTMAAKKPGDTVDNAVRINARLNAAAVGASAPILSGAVKEGKLRVVAARYDLVTGEVQFLD